jgi:hypothetical protein
VANPRLTARTYVTVDEVDVKAGGGTELVNAALSLMGKVVRTAAMLWSFIFPR